MTAMTVLAALAAGLGGPFAILREVAGVVFRAAATATALATFASGLGCTLTIVGEVARAVLATDMAGARGLLAVLGKVAGVPGMLLVAHRCAPSFASCFRTGCAVPA